MAPQQKTAVGFKVTRQKVYTGKGAIISQTLFDGEQVKGDVSTSMSEIVAAAERDASDRISRDRIPRQHQKAVKLYFSQMQKKYGKPEEPKTTDQDED